MSNDEDSGRPPASGVVTHFHETADSLDNKQEADSRHVACFFL